MSSTNGHTATGLMPEPLDDDAVYRAPQAPAESQRVRALRARVDERHTLQRLAHDLVKIERDPIFSQLREPDEMDEDRNVARKIRGKQRREDLRAGKASVRRSRRVRWQAWWDDRAERTRERILDPARNLGSDHRRWVLSAAVLFALLASGVVFMSFTVHDGLFGVDGSWIGYLVEPLASVLLIVSLGAQFTGRQRGLDVSWAFIWFDIALALSSLILNTLPHGLRYGWQAGTLPAHVLTPLLVVGAVVGWHLASRLYGEAIARSKDDPVHRERLAMLRHAIASGALAADVSANQVIKFLRDTLPGGIGHEAGRRLARSLLGY